MLKPERLSEVNEEQPLNIYLISVTFVVLNIETSRVSSFEQPSNISDMFVAFDVSIALITKCSSDDKLANK